MWLCDSRYGTAAFCGFILSFILDHKHNPSCVGLMVSIREDCGISSASGSSVCLHPNQKCEATVLPLKIGEIQMHPTILQIASTSIDWNRSTKLQEMPSIHLDSNHCLRCQPVGFDSSHSTNLTAKFDMCQLEYYPMNPFQEGKFPCVPSSNSNIHMNCRLEPVFRGQKCSFSIFSQLGQKLFKVIESYGSGNSMFNSEISH